MQRQILSNADSMQMGGWNASRVSSVSRGGSSVASRLSRSSRDRWDLVALVIVVCSAVAALTGWQLLAMVTSYDHTSRGMCCELVRPVGTRVFIFMAPGFSRYGRRCNLYNGWIPFVGIRK